MLPTDGDVGDRCADCRDSSTKYGGALRCKQLFVYRRACSRLAAVYPASAVRHAVTQTLTHENFTRNVSLDEEELTKSWKSSASESK